MDFFVTFNFFLLFASRFFFDEHFSTIFFFAMCSSSLPSFCWCFLHYVINVVDKFYWSAPLSTVRAQRSHTKFFLHFIRFWRNRLAFIHCSFIFQCSIDSLAFAFNSVLFINLFNLLCSGAGAFCFLFHCNCVRRRVQPFVSKSSRLEWKSAQG